MDDAGSSGWPRGHLDIQLTLTLAPLSGSKAELCVCVGAHVCGGQAGGKQRRQSLDFEPLRDPLAGCASRCPFYRRLEMKWQLNQGQEASEWWTRDSGSLTGKSETRVPCFERAASGWGSAYARPLGGPGSKGHPNFW